jgi:TPR repeat protein
MSVWRDVSHVSRKSKEDDQDHDTPNDYLQSDLLLHSPRDSHTCNICFDILKIAVTCSRNHSFCKTCLKRAFNVKKECPVCRDPLISIDDAKPNFALRDEIDRETLICCPSKLKKKSDGTRSENECQKNECTWQGSVRDAKEHMLVSCQYAMVNCPLDVCVARVQRRNLQQHASESCLGRNVACEFCKVVVTACSLEKHLFHCVMRLAPCPYGCMKEISMAPKSNVKNILSTCSIPAQLSLTELYHHLPLCPAEEVYCSHGCEELICRKDMIEHVKLSHEDIYTKETSQSLVEPVDYAELVNSIECGVLDAWRQLKLLADRGDMIARIYTMYIFLLGYSSDVIVHHQPLVAEAMVVGLQTWLCSEVSSGGGRNITDCHILFGLGLCNATNMGGSEDLVESLKYFRLAALQGHGYSEYHVGMAYFHGKGVEVNKAEAFQWFRLAADRGLAIAQCQVGTIFCHGLKALEGDVPKDFVEAIKWFRKSADQSFSIAQYEMGLASSGDDISDIVDEKESQMMKFFCLAANKGHGEAQLLIGKAYNCGEGVVEDKGEAVRWFKRAADQGDTRAQCELGHAYFRGEGVVKDEQEALRWFRLAAEQESKDGQFNLGLIYVSGEFVSEDCAEALQWFRLAADQQHAAAQYMVGNAYYLGKGISQNKVEGLRWYNLSANQGYACAQHKVGYIYYCGDGLVTVNKVEALRWCRLAADQGNADSQNVLGQSYSRGDGVVEDKVEALRWYRMAAVQGEKNSQFNIGCAYYYGNGVSKDKVEAMRWIRQAADQGMSHAQCNIGYAYLRGQGVTEDKAEGLRWFRLAADQGDVLAQFNLGEAYRLGEGVTVDKAEALKWFLLAADQGDIDAQYEVGMAYFYGQGVSKDMAEGMWWFRLAAEQGHTGYRILFSMNKVVYSIHLRMERFSNATSAYFQSVRRRKWFGGNAEIAPV